MIFLISFLTLLLSSPLGSQADKPVKAEAGIENFANDSVRLYFDLSMAEGWHVYSTGLPSDGPISASVQFDSISGAVADGELLFQGEEHDMVDPLFEMEVRFFENKVRFYQNVRIVSDDYVLKGVFTFGACDNKSCLPPQRVEFGYYGPAASGDIVEAGNADTGSDLSVIDGYDEALWKPVTDSLLVMDSGASVQTKSILGILLAGFLGGLLALLTPCVWPVIPMTVSMFIKRSGNKRESIRDAILYGLSIIVVYVGLGLLVTLIFGASALNALATNAVPNLIFFAILVFFAVSFFGAFELTLPSSWSTGASNKSRSGKGFASIFLMAVTLTLVSFSCTGPIIGFLLVDAVSNGGIMRPMIGMLGFSIALALPFTLFAMFPGWLKNVPKSGSWMDKVKVTLGFIELAFSLKFLSVADMAYGWGILPRDLFVLLWLLMAVTLGLYLLGIVRFSRKSDKVRPGKWSILGAVLSLGFAVWLIPGLWGAPLKAISAFTPPMSTQIWNLTHHQVEARFLDYEEGMRFAASEGKPVLLDFTGYGCVNCRKMEAAVWTDTDIRQIIDNDYVLISLFVDDKTPLPRHITINENGQIIKLRTVGDKWSLLQRHKFGSNAQPFYLLLDAEGNPLNGSYTFDTDVNHFRKFLMDGLDRYK
jgi:thiol:disulfide interchange protein